MRPRTISRTDAATPSLPTLLATRPVPAVTTSRPIHERRFIP